MKEDRVLSFEFSDRATLDRAAEDPLPFDLPVRQLIVEVFRDVYLDTPAGDLHRRGAHVRLRVYDSGRRLLTADVREPAEDGGVRRRTRVADVPDEDIAALVRGDSEPAALVRALVDPELLGVAFQLETLRRIRLAEPPDGDGDSIRFAYDSVTLRRRETAADIHQLEIRIPEEEAGQMAGLVQAFETQYMVRPVLGDLAHRARDMLEDLEVAVLEQAIRGAREVAVLPYHDGRVALLETAEGLRVMCGLGTGEAAARLPLRAGMGRAGGALRLLGVSSGSGARPTVEVWVAEGIGGNADDAGEGSVWLPVEQVLGMVGGPALRHPRTLAALNVLARSELPVRSGEGAPELPVAIQGQLGARSGAPPWARLAAPVAPGEDIPPDHLLNEELLRLAFDERILTVCNDPDVPLLERVRFLSMFGARQDEFFMRRVAKYKDELSGEKTHLTPDGLGPAAQLDAIGVRARELLTRAYITMCTKLVPALAAEGIQITRWDALDEQEQDYLRSSFGKQAEAVIVPLAADPSHPFPHIRNLRPALAVVLRLPESASEHFVAIELPGELPRFVPLPGGARFIPLEEVIVGTLPELYPGFDVAAAHTFRVTRSAATREVDEDGPLDVLRAVEERIASRPFRQAVRLEVDRPMPAWMRAHLLARLQAEDRAGAASLTDADVYAADWLVDLAALKELAAVHRPDLRFPPAQQSDPFEGAASLIAEVADKDRLLEFPRDDFERTVVRLLEEAADDPDVVNLRVTLYRTDRASPVVAALRRARANGKDVLALVELKASFDEQRNIEWAKTLERSGIHVIFSPPRYKVHAKLALVTRREGEGLARYAYVGTGNLNAATAAAYVDVGILTRHEGITDDVNAVFNLLSGYSAPGEFGHLLVAPFNMAGALQSRIEREVEHARAGGEGLIRGQFNGLTDHTLIGALYGASQQGVRVELAVRELVALRPGVEGLSENIRIVSRVGRYLQHSRIFHFHNAGEPEYFIGSGDLRPRNLRRRIEVATPVYDADHQAALDGILTDYLEAPDAWTLQGDGSWRRGEQVVGGPVGS
ncbi:MAG: polyphosphate kinase 1 [Gemmatimonadota bacterium]